MARLKVTFNRVYFKENLTVPHARFLAEVLQGYVNIMSLSDGENHAVSLVDKMVDLTDNGNWSKDFVVADDAAIKIRFTLTATNPNGWGNVGGVVLALTQLQHWAIDLVPPQRTRRFLTETDQYVLDWEIERVDGGGQQLPDQVDVLRLHRQHNGRGTISGTRDNPIVEFHPIVPVPEIGAWKGPLLSKSKRRVRSKLTHNVIWNPHLKYPIKCDENSPPNVFPNPAAIPILGDSDRTADKCARIEFTRYSPSSMRFKPNDARLRWDYVSLDGQGEIGFLDPRQMGPHVHVYGKREGEVELRVRYCSSGVLDPGEVPQYVGWYRALVKRIRKIPYRVNILDGPNRSDKPRCRVDDIEAHVRIANMFLRQMAAELQLDQNDTKGPEHLSVSQADISRVAGHDGYFHIDVPRGWTRNVDALGNSPPCMSLNYRDNVVNILYVKNIKPILKTTIAILTFGMRRKGGIGKEDTCGQAVSWPRSRAGEFIYDAPPGASLAWGLGYGRGYGARPEVQKMKLSGNSPAPGHANCFALFLSDKMGNPTKTGSIGPVGRGGRYRYGVTLAHEVSHIMNLKHRRDLGDGKEDGLQYPRLENVMYYMAWSMCQDFDIIQTKAVHQSPLGHY